MFNEIRGKKKNVVKLIMKNVETFLGLTEERNKI